MTRRSQLVFRLMLMLLLIIAKIPAFAAEPSNVWQYSVPLEAGTERRAYLWIPPKSAHINGVLLGLQNMLERPMFEDATTRAAVARAGLAIVWISPGAWPGKLDTPEQPSLKFSPPQDAIDGVQRALDALAKESGYPEVASAPLLVTGHSAASPFVWGMAKANSNRVFAALPYKGYAVGDGGAGVPTLYVSQEWAEWGKSWGEVWRKELETDAGLRKKNPQALLGTFVDFGAGHFDWHAESAGVIALFIEKAAKYRLSGTSGHLAAFLGSSGVVVDPLTLGTENLKAVPASAGQPGWLWYFDREMAEAVNQSMRRGLGRLPQAIDFVVDGAPAPLVGNGFAVLKPAFLADGVTFRLQAEPLDHSPSAALYGGAALGHAEGPITYRVGSGALVQTGPDTFKVAARPGGLTRQGQPWEPWIIAYQAGNARFRSTDKPAHVLVDVRSTTGAAQTISWGKIGDVRVGAKPFVVEAKASSGLPVELFVESGPAVIEGTTLKLLQIPPGSHYPVRVIVSAFQWGRVEVPGGEKAVQTAGPVTQEFFIRQ